MAAFTSLALTAAGVGLSVYSAKKQAKAQTQYANAQATAASQTEEARKKQMELDARRRQREVIRQHQRARSQALTNATAQGAQRGSGLPGGYGQIAGQSGTNLLGIDQNLELGRDVFAANAALTQASVRYASQAGQYGTLGALGSGLSSLGGAFLSNLGAIDRLTTNASARMNPYGSIESTGLYDAWSGMRGGSNVSVRSPGGLYF